MKPPIHSPDAIKAFPAPDRAAFRSAKGYAEACQRVERARIGFDGRRKSWIQRIVGWLIGNQARISKR